MPRSDRPHRDARAAPALVVVATVTIVGICTCTGRAGAQSLPTTPIVLSGQTAPGTGATFDRFGSATIGPAGHVRFDAVLTGPSVTAADDTAAFVRPPAGGGAALQLLAREGQPAPGIAGSVLGEMYFGPHAITADGHSLVSGELRTAGASDGRGFFIGTPGDLRLMYRPGPNEVVHGHPLINAGPRAAIWTQGHQIIHSTGAQATVVATPGEYFQPTLNGAGRIAMTAYNTDGPPGLYAGTPGDFQPAVLRGDTAPGTPAGRTFDVILDASQNNAGQFAFLASARSEEPETYAWGLWAGRPGELRLLAQDAQQAPGLPKGLRFGRLLFDIDSPQTPPIGPAGHVPFWATLEDDTGAFMGTGAWLAAPDGGIRLLARSGDAAAATLPGGGTTQLELGSIDYHGLWVNRSGQVVLTAVDSIGRGSLFAAGADGALHLIASPDVPFQVAPGDIRVVSDVLAGVGTGGEDGRPTAFNDAGQFLYRLSFADGSSGLFMTTVPEPGLAPAAAIVVAALTAFRRRPRPPVP